MNEVFVGAIFPDDWYNSQEEKISEYIGNKRSILVGMPRLRQLRVKKSKFLVVHQHFVSQKKVLLRFC